MLPVSVYIHPNFPRDCSGLNHLIVNLPKKRTLHSRRQFLSRYGPCQVALKEKKGFWFYNYILYIPLQYSVYFTVFFTLYNLEMWVRSIKFIGWNLFPWIHKTIVYIWITSPMILAYHRSGRQECNETLQLRGRVCWFRIQRLSLSEVHATHALWHSAGVSGYQRPFCMFIYIVLEIVTVRDSILSM